MQRAEFTSEETGDAAPRLTAGAAPRVCRARGVRLRRARKIAALGVLAVPVLACVLIDASRRGERLLAFDGSHTLTYVGAIVESFVLWATLLYAASRRSGWARWISAVLFVVAVTFSFGGQSYFYQQYHAYLNVDVSMFASNFMDSVLNQLFADMRNYLAAKLPPFIVAIGLVVIARKVVRPRRTPAIFAQIIAPLALVGALFIPTQHRHLQASTPDVLYLHAVGGAVRTGLGMTNQADQVRPRARESLPVAKLTGTPPVPRNVMLVILESVRADAACIEYDPDCRRTEATNLLLPNRFPLMQMRALDSSTAISLAVLWSGVAPTESRDVLHTWPLLFDYARAAGWDTAYWTSQSMLFGNARLWIKGLGVSKIVTATDLDRESDVDMGAPEKLLAARVNAEIGSLREPFFAVVHLSNGHFPYYVDPDGPQPFQPAGTSKAPADNASLFNTYRNAIYQEDQHVATMIQGLRATERGQRTVILYVSDHGEAFWEHGHGGHTFSVLDEEIHVPAWVDAPSGTLTSDEARSLTEKKDTAVFQVDVTPTILDLMGVLDDAPVAEYRRKWPGHTLLRPEVTTEALPLTNCAGVWSCAFENWGFMRGGLKLEAESGDEAWHCFDVLSDPGEKHDLAPERCADLERVAIERFGHLPGRE